MVIVKENVNNVKKFNLLYDLVGWEHMIKKYQKSIK